MARTLGIVVHDSLPGIEREGSGGGGRTSEVVGLVEEVMGAVENGDIGVNAAVCIATYDKPGGAAGCAGLLRKRFGPKEAYGLTIATRRVDLDDGSKGTGVFVLYDPASKVNGADVAQDAKYQAYLDKLKSQAKIRKAKELAGE